MIDYKNNKNLNTKQFIKLVVGYWAFYKKYDLRQVSKAEVEMNTQSTSINRDSNYIVFVVIINNKETSFEFELNSLELIVFRDECKLFVETKSILFFKEEIGSTIFDLFILVSLDYIDPIKDYDYSDVNIAFHFLSTRCLGKYRFIIGAGVSQDYGIKIWDEFVYLYNDEAKSYLNISLEKILKSSYNTTYGSFQVVKDLNLKRYYEILETEILEGSATKKTKYTTLTGLADVISSQYDKTGDNQVVITLNYDSLLEQKIVDFKQSPNVLFKGLTRPKVDGITINHIHGFIDAKRGLSTKYLKDAIVLSNDEYMRAYSNTGYAYTKLKKQLEQPCVFVGNSITDYEEQKVIKNQFDSKVGTFHFAFIKFEGGEVEFYRMLRLIKIGILPIYFTSFNEIAKELKEIAIRTRLL